MVNSWRPAMSGLMVSQVYLYSNYQTRIQVRLASQRMTVLLRAKGCGYLVLSLCRRRGSQPIATAISMCALVKRPALYLLFRERHPVRFRSSRRSEEHTSELQSPDHLVCRLLLEKKKITSLNTRTCR